MSPIGLRSMIDSARRLVRRDAMLAVAAVVAGMVPLALLASWLLGGLPAWTTPGPLPLLVLSAAVAAAIVLGFIAARLWVRGIDESAVAARAEETVGLPAGSLRGVLELGRAVPAGTSEALFRRAESDVARSFLGRNSRDVTGTMGRSARRRLAAAAAGLAGLSLSVAALALASPRRTQASWAPLLHPVAHLTPPPLPPLQVTPGDAAVSRGEDLQVRVRAPGRDAVTLVWRAEGAVVERQTLAVVSDTSGGQISRVDATTVYWVEAPDGARSQTYTVSPVDPMLVSELVVEVVFPAYLETTPERFDSDVPALQLPEGTRLIVRGRATRPLQDAGLEHGSGEDAVDMEVEGEHFTLNWAPATSGLYHWRLSDGSGESLAAAPAPLDITVLPDEPPEVELTYPATDTILSPDMVQLIAADASDDHGLAAARLVSWRVSAMGRAEAPTETPIALDDAGDRSLLRAMLDARDRGLLPGDTLKVLVRVTDGSPRRQMGQSRTLSLYLPGAVEMRRRVGDEADAMVRDAQDMARTARQVEQATRDLQRRTAASNARQGANSQGGTPGGRGSLDFEQAEQGRQVMEQQEELLRQMEEMRQRLDAFERSAARAGVQDAGLRKEMEELRELYNQLMTPEMRERMEELKQSLENMDPKALEQALQKLTEQQDEIRKQLEKSLETLRRASSEQQLNSLAQEARELATQQEALAETMRDRQPTAQETETQERLAEQAQQLESSLGELKSQLDRQGEPEAGEQTASAGDEARQAAERMQEAAGNARQQRGQEAAQQGQQAAERLENAAGTLEQARQSMADAWKKELQESVQQAMNEAKSLAQRQQDLAERLERGETQESQTGQQQGAEQQAGQQQGGQQQAGQKQGSQQQGGQQQAGQQQGGQQAGQQQGGQQAGGQQQGAQAGSAPGGAGNAMQAEQQALQQGLEQLGRNLAEAGDRSALLDREVGTALGRANLSMQQTLQSMQQQGSGRPEDQAAATVDALNRLAMALLQRSQEIEQSETGSALEQVMEQLAEVAKQQGSLNGQSSALMPLNLAPSAMAQQTGQMAEQQREIASRLEGLSDQAGNRDDLLGQLDAMAREADQIAQTLNGGRLPPEVVARQERLFHRLLDAGRTLEKEEYSEERVGELPGSVPVSRAPPLDPGLLNSADRFRLPTPEELRALPPAYRRLVLDYISRLNRMEPSSGANRDRN